MNRNDEDNLTINIADKIYEKNNTTKIKERDFFVKYMIEKSKSSNFYNSIIFYLEKEKKVNLLRSSDNEYG